MKKCVHIDFNGDFWKFVPTVDARICHRISEQQINTIADINLRSIAECLLKVIDLSKPLQPSDPGFENFPPKKFLGYDDWVKNMIKIYGCKNETAIYKNMQSCSVTVENGITTISPSNHSTIRGWDGMDPKFDLAIPASSSQEIIGAAVKYSIARCTGRGADLVAKKLFPDGVPETFDDYLALLNLKS